MISIIITSCHDPSTCYLTAFAAKCQLDSAGIPHEIIIVADGGTEYKWEKQSFICLRVNTGSPQGSRDAGIKAAAFNDVLLLESHVIISDISRLLLEHQYRHAAITYPIRRGEGPELFDVYAHETDWDGNLWHKKLVYSPVQSVPYRVAQFGASCFMLDRAWYLDSGGYTSLLRGWGGEEPFLPLKAWMLGREVWQVPSVSHYHYLTVGAHAEKPDLENNLAIVGYIIAGRKTPTLRITPQIEAERRRICKGPFHGNLDTLRVVMHAKEVCYA
ncbi:MAG: glycosyltransferase family protein [Candidatus Acidiferrales bacterium]